MNWRWRLARWISPQPILAAPAEEGAYIFLNQGIVSLWIKAKTLDGIVTTEIPGLGQYGPAYISTTTSGTFSGTI